MESYPWRSVLITGASSGIGRALAEALAAPGVTLRLSGRDAARLGEVEASCAARGAAVRPQVLDVRDQTAMRDWIAEAGPLDLVIANAGISAGTGGGIEPPAQARAVFDTNVGGVLNTVLPALDAMAAQPPGPDGLRGRIAVVASVAAFVGVGGAPSYCASKAAVQSWAEAMDAAERRRGIRLHAYGDQRRGRGAAHPLGHRPRPDAHRLPLPRLRRGAGGGRAAAGAAGGDLHPPAGQAGRPGAGVIDRPGLGSPPPGITFTPR
jgi:NADP-dependent 3-hydroxy acid dehydrogenase YdfG